MDIEKTIRALTGRGFAVQHFATGREAADYLDGAIDGTTVGIGGSMTATTHAVVRYMPESSASVIIFGIRIASNSFRSRASSANNPRDNSSEG